MDEIARLLWDARQTGFTVPREEVSGIVDLNSAYGIQARQVAYAGTTIAGWKLGATARPSLDVIGLDEPFIGPIPSGEIFDTGATIPLFEGQTYFAETEISIEISERLPPRTEPFTPVELAGAIGGYRASIEIVGIRIEGGPKGLGPMIIGDGGVHRATVLGPVLDPNEFGPDWPVSISLNGEEPVKGSYENLIWNNLPEALGFIADRQNHMARRLQVGDILMTGTVTGMTPVGPGSFVRSRLGSAVVDVELSEA